LYYYIRDLELCKDIYGVRAKRLWVFSQFSFLPFNLVSAFRFAENCFHVALDDFELVGLRFEL
jgi:hypothetical protein